MKLPVGYVPGVGVVAATARGGFGERLMKGMGWEEGTGLGKDATGIRTAIEVKKKEDNAGVGKSTAYDWENKWWEAAFASKLQKLGQGVVAALPHDSDDSSDDDFPPAASPRGAASGAAELRIAAALRRAATPGVGRYGGREGKLARIRSQEAAHIASAGAGPAARAARAAAEPSQQPQQPQQPPPPQGAPCKEEPAKKAKQAAAREKAPAQPQGAGAEIQPKKKAKRKAAAEPAPADEQNASGEGQSQPRKKRKKAKAAAGEGPAAAPTAPLSAAAEPGQEPTAAVPPAAAAQGAVEPPPSSTAGAKPWWGAARFVSGGALEGLQQEEAARRQAAREAAGAAAAGGAGAGFTEQQQEQVYVAAHAGKTAGKQGLGVASAPRKVGGAKWEGSRTTFAEEEEEAPEREGAVEGAAATPAGVGAEPSGAPKPVKWRKLCSAALQGAPGRALSLKALQKAVLQRWTVPLPLDRRKALKKELAVAVAQSSKFSVAGTTVSLKQ